MAGQELPYWYRLIAAWCEQGRTGLSVPFIVGAGTLLDDSYVPNAGDAKAILDEAFAFDGPNDFIRIKWCRDIRTYAIGICERGDIADGITFGKVFVSSDIIREFGETPEEIATGLAAEFEAEIAAGQFSVFRGKWRPFDGHDKNFITAALGIQTGN